MTFAENFAAFLDEKQMHHSEIRKEDDGTEMLHFGVTLQTNSTIDITLIFYESGRSVQTVGYNFVSLVTDEKFPDVLMKCNDLNNRYRFVKFSIDNENKVLVKDDAFLDEHSSSDEIWAGVITMIRIVEKAIPEIMKVIWG